MYRGHRGCKVLIYLFQLLISTNSHVQVLLDKIADLISRRCSIINCYDNSQLLQINIHKSSSWHATLTCLTSPRQDTGVQLNRVGVLTVFWANFGHFLQLNLEQKYGTKYMPHAVYNVPILEVYPRILFKLYFWLICSRYWYCFYGQKVYLIAT